MGIDGGTEISQVSMGFLSSYNISHFKFNIAEKLRTNEHGILARTPRETIGPFGF